MPQQAAPDLLGIAVIFATLLSPLIALWVTIIYQRRDRSYQLKLSVFVELMRHRRKNLSQEYVNSLNLVPVVFHDKPAIVSAFKEVMEVYESNDWRVPQESPSWLEIRQRLIQTLQTKTAVLLSNMAGEVRVRVDQLTILQGAYLPEQWSLEEKLDNEIKLSLMAILAGQRPLRVFAQTMPPEAAPKDEATSKDHENSPHPAN